MAHTHTHEGRAGARSTHVRARARARTRARTRAHVLRAHVFERLTKLPQSRHFQVLRHAQIAAPATNLGLKDLEGSQTAKPAHQDLHCASLPGVRSTSTSKPKSSFRVRLRPNSENGPHVQRSLNLPRNQSAPKTTTMSKALRRPRILHIKVKPL